MEGGRVELEVRGREREDHEVVVGPGEGGDLVLERLEEGVDCRGMGGGGRGQERVPILVLIIVLRIRLWSVSCRFGMELIMKSSPIHHPIIQFFHSLFYFILLIFF